MTERCQITPGAPPITENHDDLLVQGDVKGDQGCSDVSMPSEEGRQSPINIDTPDDNETHRRLSPSTDIYPDRHDDDQDQHNEPVIETSPTDLSPSSTMLSVDVTFDFAQFLQSLESYDPDQIDDALDRVVDHIIETDHIVALAGLYQRRSGRVDAIRRFLSSSTTTTIKETSGNFLVLDRLHTIAKRHSCLESMLVLAEAGHVESQHALALMYSEDQRQAEFELWLERAADAGHVLSMMGMVSLLAQRYPERSFAYARRAAQAGLRTAQYVVGRCLILGQGVPADLQAGLEFVVKAADAGMVDAQVLAAGILIQQQQQRQDDDRQQVDVNRAICYFEMASDQNNPEALYILGSLLMSGTNGVPADPARGAELIRRAAEADNPRAQLDLGKMYNAGEHLAEDFQQGFSWCLRAAQHGLPMGAFIIGIMHLEGMGCERNVLSGCHWIERAAHAHNNEARKILATLLSDAKIRDAYQDWKMTQSLLTIMAPSLRLNLIALT